ncbi:hypothetical protein L6452_34307 [Arctium lappa]|uniref:Uncharacterized protein n=1 Tax=Arctium lappa TaxID=4217 RepID=A0ACB8YJE5_ARCLA|nr:hypothetical protein L6452_34307 [Arctium lappa]
MVKRIFSRSKRFRFKRKEVEARVTITCSKLADEQKYEGPFGYGSAAGTTSSGGGSTVEEFGSVRQEWDSIGVRPELCSGVGPEGECGLRPDGLDDELPDCVADSPDSGEKAVDIDDEEAGDGALEIPIVDAS